VKEVIEVVLRVVLSAPSGEGTQYRNAHALEGFGSGRGVGLVEAKPCSKKSALLMEVSGHGNDSIALFFQGLNHGTSKSLDVLKPNAAARELKAPMLAHPLAKAAGAESA
jgi:hypothetical protein